MSSPHITVTSLPQPGGIELTFRANHVASTPQVVHVIPDRSRIDRARAVQDEGLTELKSAMNRHRATGFGDDDTYKALKSLGRTLIYQIFDGHLETIARLVEFWKSAVPGYRNPAVVPFVECIGSDASILPLELMPFFRLHDGAEILNRSEFIDGCQDFVGFSCVVRRQIVDLSTLRSTVLHRDTTGRVPLSYLQHDGLGGVREEWAWFTESAGDTVSVEGPYPSGGSGAPSIPRLIYEPCLTESGTRRDPPDQIQHFSCHCLAGPEMHGDNFELQLHSPGESVHLTLKDLGSEWMRYLGEDIDAGRAVRGGEKPLVVMNACGSSAIGATNSMSFPRAFLRNGNRGYIGSEISIPDRAASAFTRFFYDRLLLNREPLGLAALGARRDLLAIYGNPLGLAYAVYADPDLQVEVRDVREEEAVA